MKRTSRLPLARDLYVQGFTLDHVAAHPDIAVSRNTIAAWKKRDKGTKQDWDTLRSQFKRKSPLALLQTPEGWRQELIDNGDGVDARAADALYKLQRVIDSVRAQVDDPSRIITALEHFSRWCVTSTSVISADDLETVRRVIERYCEDLRGDK